MRTTILRRVAASARRFEQCERGGFSAFAVGLTIVAVTVTLGAVDLGRLWLVQSRLQTAVDATALAAGRPAPDAATRAAYKTEAVPLFFANFGRTDKVSNVSFMGATASAPVITDVGTDTVKVTASATIGTLMSQFNTGTRGTQTIGATASVKRAVYGMELALVLDVTGSMGAYTAGGSENMAALRTAATNLVNILYGNNETVPNFSVSVVPYTATVNIGSQRTNWLVPGSLDQSKYYLNGWGGCVEARSGTEDRTDTLASAQPFRPYFWTSTMQLVNGVWVSRYVDASNPLKTVPGDNDWTPSKITEQNQTTLPDNTAVGPNLGCPAFPILPLTSAKTTVLDKISTLRSTFRGGTMGNLGLQIGWFTLSPTWKGQFGDANSPLPYNTTSMDKVVVMMTDGNNEWYDWPGGAPGAAPASYVQPYPGATSDADYTAYGRLSEKRLGASITNNSLARDEINQRTTTLCTSMKAQGVIIYTVVLGSSPDAATKNLWQGCATKPEYYFNSPDKAALQAAFTQIGTKLASVRISQ